MVAAPYPPFPLFCGCPAPHRDADSIRNLLVEQIVSPVLWEDTMVKLIATEGARFVELAPGRTLAGLAKRINRRLPIESVATAEALSAAAAAAKPPQESVR